MKPQDEIASLAERIGGFIEHWGFKRIHGKIWCHVFLSSSGLTTAQLLERTGVSKGLLSIAINELLQFKVLYADHKIKNGAVVYKSNPKITEAIVEVLRGRERTMLADIWASFELLKQSRKAGAHPELDQKNFRDLETMITSARNALDFLIFSAASSPNMFERIKRLV